MKYLYAIVAMGLTACGDQLVEFALNDAGSNQGTGDSVARAPTVIMTSPLDTTTNVSVNKRVTATFSRAMNGATLTSSTFTVHQGTTPIAGAVSYSGTTATFTPRAR